MKKFSSTNIAVQQGSQVLFSDYADGGIMWTGQDKRESRHAVTFAERFTDTPSVMTAISMWDIDHKHNARLDVSAEDVTEAGFQIVFRTWSDTRIARVRVDWTAIGPARDDDDWDVE